MIAFRRTEVELVGDWLRLPWHGSGDPGKWITGNDANGFRMGIGAVGRMVGKLPLAGKLRIQGAYQVNGGLSASPGDGVIRLNGAEVLRVPHGKTPFLETAFDVDISPYAGQYVLLEFTPDGRVGANSADWKYPKIVVQP